MRAVRMTCSLVGALALLIGNTGGPAQESGIPSPDVRYIIQAATEVRSGPSTTSQFYATNRLTKGEAVVVVQERADGWVAIRPPAESFSWINTRFLHHIVPNQDNWVVVREGLEVPVLIGSALHKGKPTVMGARVRRGTQVRSIGRVKADEDGTWMPIEPPPGEVRYVRKESLSKLPPEDGTTGALASDPDRAGGPPAALAVRSRPLDGDTRPEPRRGLRGDGGRGGFQATFTATPRPRTVDLDGLWREAEESRAGGRWQEAIRRFDHLATLDAYDPQRAEKARDVAHELETAWQEGRLGPERRFRHPDGTPPGPPLPYAQTRVAPPAYSPPQGTERWSGPGRLRIAGRGLNGQQAWMLEDPQTGSPKWYVVAGPGVNLASYPGYVVDVYGPVVYSGEMRRYVITALQIRQVP